MRMMTISIICKNYVLTIHCITLIILLGRKAIMPPGRLKVRADTISELTTKIGRKHIHGTYAPEI